MEEEGLKSASTEITMKTGKNNYEEYRKRRGYKSKIKNNNTQQEIPQVNIDNIMNKFRYKNIDKFNNDLSIREKEIMESLGIADPSQLKQNTTFTVDGATAILPGNVFNLLVETSTTFNVIDGNGQYSIDISNDGISFVTSQGLRASRLDKTALDFGVNVGKQFNVDLNNGTKISWDVGFDKLGPKLIYTFDHSNYDQTVDQMNVRAFPNDRTLKTTMVVSGTVGVVVLAPEVAPLVPLIPKLEPYIQNFGTTY